MRSPGRLFQKDCDFPLPQHSWRILLPALVEWFKFDNRCAVVVATLGESAAPMRRDATKNVPSAAIRATRSAIFDIALSPDSFSHFGMTKHYYGIPDFDVCLGASYPSPAPDTTNSPPVFRKVRMPRLCQVGMIGCPRQPLCTQLYYLRKGAVAGVAISCRKCCSAEWVQMSSPMSHGFSLNILFTVNGCVYAFGSSTVRSSRIVSGSIRW